MTGRPTKRLRLTAARALRSALWRSSTIFSALHPPPRRRWVRRDVGFTVIMQSLEQIEGIWPEPEFKSGLVLRCHAARKKPIDQLSDLELATLLEQDIGVAHVLPVAVRRLSCNQPDDTEHFDGQLKEAVDRKTQPKD